MAAFGMQSSSERHGEQNVPSPTQTPARGMHAVILAHVCPWAQSPALAHSGLHAPPTQCW